MAAIALCGVSTPPAHPLPPLAVFGTAYWFYTRRGGTAAAAAAAGSGGSAGPGSGGKVVDGAQWGHGPVEEASLMPGTQQQPRAGGSWV